MLQSGSAGTINQTHSGLGDNVQNKILIQIQALAPASLSKAIGLVLGSIRAKRIVEAKLQLDVLRATVPGNSEAADLLDVIAIYGELVEPEHTQDAFNTVARIAVSTKDEIVRDLCIAALLKFSLNTVHEEAAKTEYFNVPEPGIYSQEAFYRHFAPRETLDALSRKLLLNEGELTGLVEGMIRLGAIDAAAPAADRLHQIFPTYTSRYLLLQVKASQLEPAVLKSQHWLCSPEVKQGVNELCEELTQLIELSEGGDARLYEMVAALLDYLHVVWPTHLVNTCVKYSDQMAATKPELAKQLRAVAGDDSARTEQMQSLKQAQSGSEARRAWCQARLDGEADLQDAVHFTRLATPGELRRWLELEKTFEGVSDIESAVVLMLARAKLVALSDNALERYELAQAVDEFVASFESQFIKLAAHIVVDLVQAIFDAELPHKGLAITSPMLPEGELWPSPFILLHLRCLLETEQFQSFDELIARIPDQEHVSLLQYRSMKEEALGDHERALALSDQVVHLAPGQLVSWLRGCQLRERFRNAEEQRRFHDAIPDHLLETFSHNTMLAMRYLTSTGNFGRAEPRLVRWFVEDPAERAVALVNFHLGFGLRRQATFVDSQCLPGYLKGVSYEHEGVAQVRLIVEEGVATGQYVLVKGSPLADLLESLEVGQSAKLGLADYRLIERLPPYVACFRLALQLRHLQSDGEDAFSMFTLPADPAQLGSFLEQKLGFGQHQERAQATEKMPLYLQGHAMQPSDPIKAALVALNRPWFPRHLQAS
ncbi:hypothetical protein [Pseudomonas sp. PNPG3]|uniref:hypothetical protein n=1 Tax=Pseudomonas sp. PNPG3 TaxID=2919497 RepID=UPI001FFC3EBB|nr:hypothetical protein [Pseudomonas sp. PNPG3]MCK2124812.1 hypothetical protein [Pseudomonas sp. PNPG3]